MHTTSSSSGTNMPGSSGGGPLALQPAFFFGPPGCTYTTQYSSLPRHSRTLNTPFQRNTPIRRSTGIPEHHLEYFVPRSMSEFNLAGVGDLALPPSSRRCSPTETSSMAIELPLPLPPIGVQLGGPSQTTLLCGQTITGQHTTLPTQQTSVQSAVQQPPTGLQLLLKPREKMVTFEDESKSMSLANSTQQLTAVVGSCPHRTTTPLSSAAGAAATSRKAMTTAGTTDVMSFM